MSEREIAEARSLARLLEWLGIVGCTCPYEWRGIGVLYGVSFGKGWVRMRTTEGCPDHDQ